MAYFTSQTWVSKDFLSSEIKLTLLTGIVTKMGIWLQPQPETYMTCTVSVEKEEDLVPLIAILSDLQGRNII